MSKNQLFKTDTVDFNDLLTKQQLTLLRLDEELLSNAIEYCDFERLGLLSILNPSASMLY
jgi:hypothetical protein